MTRQLDWLEDAAPPSPPPPPPPTDATPLPLRPLDVHFGRCLEALTPQPAAALGPAAALASFAAGQGASCIDLTSWAGRPGPGPWAEQTLPPMADWRRQLLASEVVATGEAGVPLVLDAHNRLYLLRFFADEAELARVVQRLAGAPVAIDEHRLQTQLDRLFASGDPDQRLAAANAALGRLAIVSGGPGTGKTTTVVRLLALLVALWPHPTRPPRIALAAPTGKAANRLAQSVAAQLAALPDELAEPIPTQAVTLHRLLGYQPGRERPAHDARRPLHADIIVIDEASMVDLAMMARLARALPETARLILLGDRDQLASVQAGAVLGDLCAGFRGYSSARAARLRRLCPAAEVPEQAAASPMANCITLLRHSYRFRAEGGIGRLAVAVRAGDPAATRAALTADDPAVRLQRLAPTQPTWAGATALADQYAQLLHDAAPADALAALERLRVLCALREGPFGVIELNRQIEQALRRRGLIGADGAGRAIIITRNDYTLGLFNGDIGLLAHEPEHGGLRACFPQPGGVRRLSPARLPPHESVFAMTVHKSQGSEFDEVVLVLPPQPHPLVTRELLYTGITRARERLVIETGEMTLEVAVGQPTERPSGLRERLWQPPAGVPPGV